jgi:predicted acylesterase/phospholipase RssA
MMRRALTPEAAGSRYWPDADPVPLLREAAAASERERASLHEAGLPAEKLPSVSFLAISGGGDAGAFGAGLLVGWTAQGTRPQFKMVTGVSAGALIAPFAFLGPRYDGVLTKLCTSINPSEIFHTRNLIAGLSADGIADDTPLAALISKLITPDMLADVAREYRAGRLLLIATTDLDAGQRVVWNMGAIASSPDPRAPGLFRKVILASMAVPGLFPPVMIDVEVDGRRYQEMHVDGGVMSQVFLPLSLFVQRSHDPREYGRRERHVYVIRNGLIDSHWQVVARRTADVARRALDALIEVQGLNDLNRLEFDAQQEGEDFNVAFIDDAFNYPHRDDFAADYIRQLFDYSYQLAVRGDAWRRGIPRLTWSGDIGTNN